MRMRVIGTGDGLSLLVEVTLSRRNLRALLAKLDGAPDSSERAIALREENGSFLVVRAEEDAAHYAGREPGPMHPDTEAAIG